MNRSRPPSAGCRKKTAAAELDSEAHCRSQPGISTLSLTSERHQLNKVPSTLSTPARISVCVAGRYIPSSVANNDIHHRRLQDPGQQRPICTSTKPFSLRPNEEVSHARKVLACCTSRLLYLHLSDKVLFSEHFVHQSTDTMNVFVADLTKMLRFWSGGRGRQ